MYIGGLIPQSDLLQSTLGVLETNHRYGERSTKHTQRKKRNLYI